MTRARALGTTAIWLREKEPALLLAAHASVWIAVLLFGPADALADDVARFVQVATHPGLLYRDFQVEYMPLEALLVRVLGGTVGEVGVRVVTISAMCDVAVYLLVSSLHGRRAGVAYLWFALPLQLFMLYRLDLISVVLVLAALAAARRGRAVTAGVVFGAAVMFKAWPLVLLPLIARRGGKRALIGFVCVTSIAVGAWLVVGGPDAIRYVTSFRGAGGWHVESTVGSLVAMLGGEEPRFELGAMRTGSIAPWTLWGLRVVGLMTLVAVWWKACREGSDAAGLPAAAAAATLIATSPVASAQYVSWLLPWAAVAVTERRRHFVLAATAAASLLAAASFIVYWEIWGGIDTLVVIALLRAVAVASIPLAWLTEGAQGAR